MYSRLGKRLFDLMVSVSASILLLPVLAVLGLIVRFRLGAPVLFRQVRPGRNGRPFTIYKFRTMTNARDASGDLLPDAQRLPRFGQFLRACSLDELPEMFNVFKGDMSLVGPRPLLMQYLVRYNPTQMRRHEVLPGLTGWAQVNGRNAVTWDEKFDFDVWYVDNMSFALDFKILMLTVKKVFTREGISAGGHATMVEFVGQRR